MSKPAHKCDLLPNYECLKFMHFKNLILRKFTFLKKDKLVRFLTNEISRLCVQLGLMKEGTVGTHYLESGPHKDARTGPKKEKPQLFRAKSFSIALT